MQSKHARTEPRHELPVTIIEPPRGWARLNLRDLWDYRELLFLLVWRDLKSRYKQTAVGAVWVVLQPLLLMSLFALIFGRLVRIQVGDIPRPIFYYSGLSIWSYFSQALNHATSSVVQNQALVTKVYFPRIVLPVAAVLPNLVDLGISLVILIGMVLVFGFTPGVGMVFVPLFTALALGTALGAGLWLGALNARYRDVNHGIAFMIQVWFFATPILYPASRVPESWRPILALNPMATVIEGFRWATLGSGDPPSSPFISVSIIAVILITGIWFFRKHETAVADVV
jgi:lipopolysaccharide transport system permease protein